MYNRKLMKQYGGYLPGAVLVHQPVVPECRLGLHPGLRHRLGRLVYPGPAGTANSVGYMYASNSDQAKLWSEYNLTLWYRPVEALKFGLTYSFENTYFLQKQNNPAVGNIAPNAREHPLRRGQGLRRVASHRVHGLDVLLTKTADVDEPIGETLWALFFGED